MNIFQTERDRRAQAELERQRQEIQRQLYAIDLYAVRPLRAVTAGTDTQADRDRLTELETEAQTLRDQLDALSA